MALTAFTLIHGTESAPIGAEVSVRASIPGTYLVMVEIGVMDTTSTLTLIVVGSFRSAQFICQVKAVSPVGSVQWLSAVLTAACGEPPRPIFYA